jgi:hypothetical protein
LFKGVVRTTFDVSLLLLVYYFSGAFRFNIWRFGEWQETIVDDNLPCLQTTLLYCHAYGSPPEFWGPLLEKAYAK